MNQAHQLDTLFHTLINEGGSDLHLSENEYPAYRKQGEIQPIPKQDIIAREKIELMLREICPASIWQQYLTSGDVDFAYETNGFRFRCNYYRHQKGLGAICRLIPNHIKTINELGLPKVLETFGELRSGLVLVTGPTGSGKSTTLAAILDHLNRQHARHIVTLEEPIEFIHRNKKSVFTQREIPEETPTFASGLKAALRQDADVIMVGELRDAETISLALTAAETGALVFGTLHTNNARKTIDRIVDVFPPDQQALTRTMLAATLQGVVAQLLLKQADGKGRIAANEILISTPAVAAIIREGATYKLNDLLKAGHADGMQLMDDDIENHLKQGRISQHEAYLKAVDKSRFANQSGSPV